MFLSNWEWGMGNGELGIGHREWGMGNWESRIGHGTLEGEGKRHNFLLSLLPSSFFPISVTSLIKSVAELPSSF
jgi:hypothetical protein